MTARRPRDIGTAAERAVVTYLRTAGFPHAERRALRGVFDAGDITGTPGIAWEIKGGDAARKASDYLIEQWLSDAERQAVNCAANLAVLVVQRAGVGEPNAGRWWAIVPAYRYEQLTSWNGKWVFGDRGPIRMHLSQVCALLRYAGYGSGVSP